MGAARNALAVLSVAAPSCKVAAAEQLADDWARSKEIGDEVDGVPDSPA